VTERPPWIGIDTLGPLTPAEDEARSDAPVAAGVHVLATESQAALEQARASKHGKGTRVLWAGPHQRVVLIAMTTGTALGEHKSPPAASFHVIEGSARLYCAEPTREGTLPDWIVDAGGLVPIPPERHGVEALTDCVILLTVSLDPHGDLAP
jgi:quercetin dioxygenase-like cupin family protein